MKNWIYLFTASCLIFGSCTNTRKSEEPEKYQLHIHIDSLQQGTQYACTHFPKNIKRGLSLAFRCSFERFTSVSFGKGKGEYRCGYFQITADSLFYRINRNGEANDTAVYAAAHGLTISRHLGFSVTDNAGNFTGTLTAPGKTFRFSTASSNENNGILFFSGEQDMQHVDIFASCRQMQHPVWMFGDSYFGFGENRVIGALLDKGLGDVYINGLAGQNSENAYRELEKSLQYGCPKLLVWCLGMNDNYSDYVRFVQAVKSLGDRYGFEVVYEIVPTVLDRDKSRFQEYIRSTGYRTFDAYEAVGGMPEWHEGYQSSDRVHPTPQGAQAIAGQMLKEIPELKK